MSGYRCFVCMIIQASPNARALTEEFNLDKHDSLRLNTRSQKRSWHSRSSWSTHLATMISALSPHNAPTSGRNVWFLWKAKGSKWTIKLLNLLWRNLKERRYPSVHRPLHSSSVCRACKGTNRFVLCSVRSRNEPRFHFVYEEVRRLETCIDLLLYCPLQIMV